LPFSVTSRSVRTAAAVAPGEAVRTPAAGPHNNHRRAHNTRRYHDRAAIGSAAAVWTAMEAGTAPARGFRRAKPRESARDQNCCEKVFHVFSRFARERGAGPNLVTEF
jgi:hypothetical protein